MRIAVILGAASLLAGCASQIMGSYVGRDVTDVMLDYGPPAASFDMPDGRRAFQWNIDNTFYVPTTTSYTAVQSGGLVTGSATTTGGTYSNQCSYTFFAREEQPETWTVVDFHRPKSMCE